MFVGIGVIVEIGLYGVVIYNMMCIGNLCWCDFVYNVSMVVVVGLIGMYVCWCGGMVFIDLLDGM